MQLIRMKFSKEGQLRFLSHLDLLRTIQRVFRRAQLPMAYSQGFNPHPKISFSPALPVGVSSEAEYLDVELAEHMDESKIKQQLEGQAPAGMNILEIVDIGFHRAALNAEINRAKYQIRGLFKCSREDLDLCVQELLGQEELIVKKVTKKGIKEKNIRSGIFQLECKSDQKGLCLEMTLLTGSEGNVRPEHILELISNKCGLIIEEPLIKRTGLFIDNGQEQVSPLS